MAETVTQIKAPEIKITQNEVLAAHGVVEGLTIRDAGESKKRELERGQELGKLLREKNGDKVGKDTFAEKIKMGLLKKNEISDYEKADVDKMRSEFGAGEVKENKAGKLKGPEDAVEIAKEGRDQLDKITNFFDYSAVVNEINKGRGKDDVLIEKKIINEYGNPADITWSNMRNKALDDILEVRGFKEEVFPFLKNLDTDDQREFVENTLATDPALQKKIIEKMKEVQKLKKLPEVKADKSNRGNRLEKEGELVGKLGDIIPEAISEVLIERYSKVQEVAKEQRQKETDESLLKLTQKMDKNWIKYDRESRERIVDAEKIGEDVRFLAYQGEKGVDSLLMRDLELGLKDEQGNPLQDKDGNDVDWKNVDLTQLSVNDKALFDRAKEKYGEAYKKKLLSDFGIARATEKKWLKGVDKDLRLKGFEWTLLNQNFGDKLEKDVSKLPGGEGMLKQLKDSGVDKQKDKAGWLMALLLLLGVTIAGVAKETVSAEFSDKLK